MSSPTCATIIIGNEILSGRTDDVNLNYIARRMTDLGIKMQEVRMVNDVEGDIVDAINTLRKKYTYVFTTGGIGPTHDDITIKCVAKAFGVGLERSEKVAQKLLKDAKIKTETAIQGKMRMANYPQGAQLIENSIDSIPACRVENVFSLAGVPRVCQAMLESIIPMLNRGATIFTKSLDAYISESRISIPLEDIQNSYLDVEIGSYPFKMGERIGTSIVLKSTDALRLEDAYKAVDMLLDDEGAIRVA